MNLATYESLVLPSGFRLAVSTLPWSECAAFSIHVAAGSRDDLAGLAGTAHFVEHMVFKGTQRRDARAISLDAEDAGGSLNACTTEDQVVYEARGDADSLPLLADITADIVWNATFPTKEIPLEREVIAEEIVMYRESPGDHIGDLISAALWSPHPLGESVSGSEESIARIKKAELSAFRDRHHFRNDTVISVAGPFSPQAVAEILAAHLPASREAVELVPIGSLPKPGHVIDERDTDQLQLALAWRTPGRTDQRRHALRLLSMILGESAGSRLFQELREKRGLCYHVSCDASFFAEVGSFEIHSGLAPKGRAEALGCIEREIEDLAKNGPRPEELARAKRLAASQMKMAMESTGAHASWAGDSMLQYGVIITPADALATWQAVTAEEIREVAAAFLTGDRAMAEIRP
ncbi:pitrilysin family protein [Haloferula sp. BvORR071]|uniref:M16 family metallopeptidase n=1 Tax=Haloferula sp. BvORR071 TaxID=1396141 RepID=UPI000553699F|nr:pitrilysin family protein [Haloferula sp. BvORR071]